MFTITVRISPVKLIYLYIFLFIWQWPDSAIKCHKASRNRMLQIFDGNETKIVSKRSQEDQ